MTPTKSRWLRRSIGLAFVLSASAALMQTPASATTADGTRGARIAFQRVFWTRDGSPGRIAIFTARPDGSGVKQLTHPPRGVETGRVDWSHDGQWIAYIRGTAAFDPRHFHIFRMRSNGTHRKDLSEGHCRPIDCDGEEDPTWSPGGRRIAFIRVVDGIHHLYVMRSNGTHRRMVVAPAGDGRFVDLAPEWSPDGTRLVFARWDNEREVIALFTVGVDGSDLQRITPWALPGDNRPDWSSDGRWILFSKESGAGTTQLFLMHPNGEGIRKITHTPHFDWAWAGFRPNGRGIVAVRIPGPRSENDVYVMRLDGSHLRNVTNELSHRPAEGLPDWGVAAPRNNAIPRDTVTVLRSDDPNGEPFRLFTFPTDDGRGIGLKYRGDVEMRCCVERLHSVLRPVGFLVNTVIAFASKEVRRSKLFIYQGGSARGYLYRTRLGVRHLSPRVVLVFDDAEGYDGDLVAYDADREEIARRYVGLPPACSSPKHRFCFA